MATRDADAADDADDGDDAHAPSTRGYKHRINQFFHPGDAERVDSAVKHVHAVMCDATLLIKYRLTQIAKSALDKSVPP